MSKPVERPHGACRVLAPMIVDAETPFPDGVLPIARSPALEPIAEVAENVGEIVGQAASHNVAVLSIVAVEDFTVAVSVPKPSPQTSKQLEPLTMGQLAMLPVTRRGGRR
jgi:hypothetical protein